MLLFVVGVVVTAAAACADVSDAGSVPNWEPTWNMSLSTVLMPCNMSGYMNPQSIEKWGLVDFDWSNAKALWANSKPMDCQERLIKQVEMASQYNSASKHFVYRNLVKALPWYSEVREKIEDPQYAGWFLKFKDGVNGSYHVPPCTLGKCSEFYHDQDQTPEHPHGDGSCVDACDCGSIPCGEYLWDHRNESLREFLINEFVLGNDTGVGNPLVSGVYLDDGWTDSPQPRESWWPKEGFCSHDPIGGPTEEYPNCTIDMGLTQSDTTAIKAAWQETISQLQDKLLAVGAFSWQQFTSEGRPDEASCQKFFEVECGTSPHLNTTAWQLSMTDGKNPDDVDKDLATFLLARGDHAWIGYGWIGCVSSPNDSLYYRPPQLDVDYGTPLGQCKETQSGVFTRNFTRSTISFNCNTYTPSIVMK
eukprot:m.128241 g.128241  ORF g.128241 m.128241 type:complete len:419 (-) comp13022_c0_seq6:1961-3217(-)